MEAAAKRDESDPRVVRILVLHPEAATRRSVDLALRRVSPFPVTVYEAASLTEGLETARRLEPQIALLDLSGERALAFDVARQLRRPDRLIVGLYNPLALSDREGELFREAARAGVGDFVPLPVAEEELAAALAATREFQAVTARAEGRTVSFISPKGGVGTTTLAVNTALALAARGDVEDGVALCDAVVQLGCAAAYLGLAPDRDLADMIRDLDDVGALSTHLVHHQGLWVLASPRDPLEAARIAPEDMSRALIGLRQRYGLVVVDCPPVLDLFTLAVLDLSESIFVVTAAVAPSILVTSRFLDLLAREGFAPERIRVVLNQTCPSRDVLPEKLVREQLGRPVDHTLPYDKDLVAAANRGSPPVLSRQRTEFSQTISEMADAAAHPVAAAEPRTA
jgi:pilus assembly protein CpaE